MTRLPRRSRTGLLAGAALLALTLTPLTGIATAAPTALPAKAGAAAGSDGLRGFLGLSSGERLVLKDRIVDANRTVHKRFDRTYRGLPVIGGDLVVHQAADGSRTVTWASEADLGALTSVEPTITAAAAERVAGRDTGLAPTAKKTRLVVYAIGGAPRLAWEVVSEGVRKGGPAQVATYVDATGGDRIGGWSLIEHADGKGKSLYDGTVQVKTIRRNGKFVLIDQTRGNHRTRNLRNTEGQVDVPFTDADNVWGNYTPSNPQSAAVSAAYGAAKTWDYFKAKFGRLGIRDDGIGATSYVHYSRGYDNAFWSDSCFCMVYGDGGSFFRPLVSLDVAGHEMTHGVTSNTAGLIYEGESGGLNESTSDIFGSMVEFFAANKKDKGDYIIGEKITKVAPHFLRRMDRPSRDNYSIDCWDTDTDQGEVHSTSGVGNHFFYLVAEGSGRKTINGVDYNSPTCNGTSIGGIGRGPAMNIWYTALTVYMVSTTDYTGARDATLLAARDLYGPGTAQCTAVDRSWNAVNVPVGTVTCA